MPARLTGANFTVKKVLLLAACVSLAGSCFGQDLIWHSPAPSESQARSVLAGVCPHSVQTDQSAPNLTLGCKPCPAFTMDAANSSMAFRESFDLRTAIFGSFTEAGIDEAPASFEGCEPHAAEFGGTVLLRHFAEGWNMIHYHQALITDACQKYPLQDGRDLLLCEGEDHHMDGAWNGIFTYDFSRDQASQGRNIFAVLDTRVACGKSAVWGSIDKVDIHDINGDGLPDLSIWISVGQGTFPNSGGSCGVDTSHAPVESNKLDFLFRQDTNSFLPAPWSAALVNRFDTLFKAAQDSALRAVSRSSAP